MNATKSKKRLLILGGSRYIIPVIEAAHELGCHVITMDYLPDNIAHSYSDEYANVSIVDKDAVLEAARELRVDGITSFAADPGVLPAAYVAERLGLSFQGSYEAVSILQNKGRFRAFLRDNGFNCPSIYVFRSAQEAKGFAEELPYPVIAKPVDSAGSKGCSRVNEPAGLELAVANALNFSASKTCIVEQFIEKRYPSSDADCFTVDGRFVCVSFTSQYFDAGAPNPFAPAAYAMPCGMPQGSLTGLVDDLQRLSDLLGLRTGVYNIETRVGTDGLPYIMEVTPRGGGNRLSEMLRYASGVDLVRASVQAAIGEEPQGVCAPKMDGFWYQEILHSTRGGAFGGIEYAKGFAEEHVRDEQVWVEPGTQVESFSGANHAFGTVFMRFDSLRELDEFHSYKDEFMRITVS